MQPGPTDSVEGGSTNVACAPWSSSTSNVQTHRKIASRLQEKRPAILAALLVVASGAPAWAQFTNPITTTPTLVQDGFGPAGDLLPNDGLEYCVPVSTVDALSYLGINGYNQIATTVPTAASELNLVQVMSGLMYTNAIGVGTTYLPNIPNAIQTYLSVEGISASNYSVPARRRIS